VAAVIAALRLTTGQAMLADGIADTATGVAFLLAAEGYRRAEQLLDDAGTRLIFGGLAFAGVNYLAWAWGRRPWAWRPRLSCWAGYSSWRSARACSCDPCSGRGGSSS